MAVDTAGLTVSTAYGVDAAPWTFIIDANGVIQKDYLGLTDNATLISFITPLIPPPQAPTGSITINGGDAYTNSTSVTLTLTYSSGVTIGEYSNDGVNWLGWAGPVATKAWTLSSGDGVKTVYYKVWDNGGNTAVYNDTIVLDTGTPQGSIQINNGAVYTNTTGVGLVLYATDAGSGVSQMRFRA